MGLRGWETVVWEREHNHTEHRAVDGTNTCLQNFDPSISGVGNGGGSKFMNL